MANLSIIRDICKAKDISLKELAEKIPISENGLQRILKTNSTKVDTLEKIAEVLDIDIIEFFYPQGLIPADDIVFTDFTEDVVSSVLCKRYKKFSDKLSYYMDYFYLNIFPPEHDYRNEKDISMSLRYPFKHASRPKYIFRRKDRSIYPDIPSNIRELPFSIWPNEYKSLVKENKILVESFYFPVFYFNVLNVVDYLNEGLLQDAELIHYWNEWQKIEAEAEILKLPLFIDAYQKKPVY